jgi:ParB family transcriptional regulator, chromosome partitioning protein
VSVTENVDLDKISLGNQLRQSNVEHLTELIDSIRKVGLLQPVIVRFTHDGNFQVVSGCRRYSACKALRWRTIPCVIIDAGDKEAFEVSLIENLQRASLEPLEKAQAFKKYVLESGWGGISELATKIGRSHSYVIKHIMLLKLPQDIIDLVNTQQLATSAAQELFSIKDKSKQSEIATLVVNKQLSSKNVRRVVQDIHQLNTTNVGRDQQDSLRDTRRIERLLNKSILILRIAMARIGQLIEESEDNWLVHECMMEEKNVLHNQIDAMLKRKKRLLKMKLGRRIPFEIPVYPIGSRKNANNKKNSSHLYGGPLRKGNLIPIPS